MVKIYFPTKIFHRKCFVHDLRGPFTLTWELRALEEGNLTYDISSESLRGAVNE